MSPRSGLLTYILSLPPMGILGLHQFYTGNIGAGFLRLFTLGGFGFLTLYDLVRITLNQFTDGENRTVNFRDANGRWPTGAILATGAAILLYAFCPPLIVVNPLTIIVGTVAAILALSFLGFSTTRFYGGSSYVSAYPTMVTPSVAPIYIPTVRPAPLNTFGIPLRHAAPIPAPIISTGGGHHGLFSSAMPRHSSVAIPMTNNNIYHHAQPIGGHAIGGGHAISGGHGSHGGRPAMSMGGRHR